MSLQPRDDLLLIEGITPAIEMALNNIGLLRFSDFLDHSPQSLSEALQERTGIDIPAATIAQQDWLGWAGILAAEGAAQAAAKVEEEDNEQPARENPRVQDEGGREAKSNEIPTKTSAMVEDGSEPKDFEENTETQNTGVNKAEFIEKPGATEVSLRIIDARFSAFETQAAAGTAVAKMLRGEIHCEFDGIEASQLFTEPVHFTAQLHAIHANTGESKLLASQSRRLQPERSDYRIALESRMPEVGLYQLQIIALLLRPNSKAAFRRGPFLRVIP
jgi:hypothetical protein